MQKIKKNNWKWLIADSALLNGWFDCWEDFARDSAVKRNPVRVVFKVDDLFYVKVEQPSGLWRKMRSLLLAKAGREFAVAQALEEFDVPVVKHLGWAKSGASNMLLTEAMPEARSVLEYWYSEIVYGNLSKKKFLDDFAGFLRVFFESGFYHPDFHIGNILYSPLTDSFALVDVYGISRPKALSRRQKNKHYGIFFELHRALSDAEAVDFIMQTRDELTIEEAQEFWRNGLLKRAVRGGKNWEKRQVQIENNYSKFVEELHLSGNDFLIRKQPGPVPAMDLTMIPDSLNGNYFDVMRLPQNEAENFWLESFRLELAGVDHLRPLVFEKPGTLYLEKYPENAPKATGDKAEEYIARAKNAGIEVKPEKLVQLLNGRVVMPL